VFTIKRTDSTNGGFQELVKQLDAELAIRDGEEHAFYHQFNTIEALQYVVLIFDMGVPVGCGAMKSSSPTAMEIKRMFTIPEFRGRGIAGLVLSELEKWATQLKMDVCILETGKRQPEAIALYKKHGYQIISNFGPYKGIANSVCFEKNL
jgi:GNAT superfamily N-acetyltransferase